VGVGGVGFGGWPPHPKPPIPNPQSPIPNPQSQILIFLELSIKRKNNKINYKILL